MKFPAKYKNGQKWHEVRFLVEQREVRTLQRHNTKILNKFSQKRNCAASVPISTLLSLSDLYISTIGLPILLQEKCRPILGIYKLLTDTWMWKLGLRDAQFLFWECINGISLQCQQLRTCTWEADPEKNPPEWSQRMTGRRGGSSSYHKINYMKTFLLKGQSQPNKVNFALRGTVSNE
jgi:hypothetical protein